MDPAIVYFTNPPTFTLFVNAKLLFPTFKLILLIPVTDLAVTEASPTLYVIVGTISAVNEVEDVLTFDKDSTFCIVYSVIAVDTLLVVSTPLKMNFSFAAKDPFTPYAVRIPALLTSNLKYPVVPA